MEFSKEFWKDEKRLGYTITEKQKRIWAAELSILDCFDKVCDKYGLKYWAGFGTLLGAYRHYGIIPWDDDIDVVMLRPDYEKMKTIIERELPDYYFFQETQTDAVAFTFCKIRDSRTTAYEAKFPKEANQGLFIDIFPLDDIYIGENDGIHEVERELYDCIMFPNKIRSRLQNDKQGLALPEDLLEDFIEAAPRDQMREYEAFLLNHSGQTKMVGYLPDIINLGNGFKCPREYFENTNRIPFEEMDIPVPNHAYQALRSVFGKNALTPVKAPPAHDGAVMDPDISYIEYMKKNHII